MYNFEIQTDFEAWLQLVPIKIAKLSERFKGSITLDDYDLVTIKVLSEWILEHFPNIKDLKADPVLWDELSCYVGEVYRKILDTQWSIELNSEQKDSVFFRRPIVTCNPPPPVCPMNAITALISRKNSMFIVDSIEKRIRNKG